MMKKEVMSIVALLFLGIFSVFVSAFISVEHVDAAHGGDITIESITPSLDGNTLTFDVVFAKEDAGAITFTHPSELAEADQVDATLDFTLNAPPNALTTAPSTVSHSAVYDPMATTDNTATFTFDTTDLENTGTITEVTFARNTHMIEAIIPPHEGDTTFLESVFRRSASAPSTPSGGSFDGTTLTPPTDWFDAVPSGSDPVYVSVVIINLEDNSLTYLTPTIFLGKTITLAEPSSPISLAHNVRFFNLVENTESCPRLTENDGTNNEIITTCSRTAPGNIVNNNIILFSPQFGATDRDRFTVTLFVNNVITGSDTCRFTKTIADTAPSSDNSYETQQFANIVGFNNNYYHTYEFPVVLLDEIERLHVRCGSTSGSFSLSQVSGNNPSFTLDIMPEVITELNTQNSFSTRLNLTSSQELACKIGISDTGLVFNDFNNDAQLVNFPNTDEYDANTYRDNYEYDFPIAFGNIPNLEPNALVDETSYTLSVLCKNKRGVTATNSYRLRVNTKEPLQLSEIVPANNGYAFLCTSNANNGQEVEEREDQICFSSEGSNRPNSNYRLSTDTFNIPLSVTTNKNAQCSYRDTDEEGTGTNFISANFLHEATLSGVHVGSTSVEITCREIGLISTSETRTTTFFVDTTPPTEFSINDSSSFLGLSESRTYRTDRLNISFSAADGESGIDYYAYKILKCGDSTSPARSSSSTCTDFYPHARDNPTPTDVKSVVITAGSRFANGRYAITEDTDVEIRGLTTKLQNNFWYRVEGFAVNNAGVANDPAVSDGIRVDTSLIPFSCSNNIKDGTETDVDCGGECNGCSAEKVCAKDDDCSSNNCDELSCKAATCDDKIKNGGETGVDCGGSCGSCSTGDSCRVKSDCDASSSCSDGVCVTSHSCGNGVKDVGETGIDCGGVCVTSANFRCSVGASCIRTSDCAADLDCVAGTCIGSSAPSVAVTDGGSAVAPPSSESDSDDSSGGFPFTIVLSIIFIFVLVGVLFGIRYYKQHKDFYAPPSSSPALPVRSPPTRPRILSQRRPPPRRRVFKRRSTAPKPTRDVANKVHEIPYLSGEDVFSKLKEEVVEEGKRKRPPKKRKV